MNICLSFRLIVYRTFSLQVVEHHGQCHCGPHFQIPGSAHRPGRQTVRRRDGGQREDGGRGKKSRGNRSSRGRSREWRKSRKWRGLGSENHQRETSHHLHPDGRRTVLCESPSQHSARRHTGSDIRILLTQSSSDFGQKASNRSLAVHLARVVPDWRYLKRNVVVFANTSATTIDLQKHL